MFDDQWEQTRDKLEDDIFDLLPSFILILPFFLPALSWHLHFLLSLDLRLKLFLQSLRGDINIFNVKVGSVFKRINFSNSSLDLIIELM